MENWKGQHREIIVSFIIDGMGIKKGIQRGRDGTDRGAVRGHVNFGAEFNILNNELRNVKNL